MSNAIYRAAFASLDGAGRADAVVRQLGEAIRIGLLNDGERLPPEPALAAQLGVATATLREALRTLRRQQLVRTQRGRGGGTFVTAPVAETPRRLHARLLEFSLYELRDMADFRCAAFGEAARLAAQRGDKDAFARVRTHIAHLKEATSISERRRCDGRLRLEVVAASQSARLTQTEVDIQTEIGDLFWLPLTGDQALRDAVRSHQRLVEALESHAADDAHHVAAQQIRLAMDLLIAYRLDLVQQETERGRKAKTT